MKKLSKVLLHDARVLKRHEMKNVRGGQQNASSAVVGGSGGGYAFCIGPGDVTAGPFGNCTDEFCERHYGSGSHCG